MNDEDDPIVLIFKGENYNFDTPESKNDEIENSSNIQTDEKNINLNNDSNKIEEKSVIEQIKENKKELKEEIIEEKNKKELEGEKVKKIDEFFPKNISPLDFVNYIEVERTDGIIMKEMQNFILENHIKKDNKYEVLETKTLPQINNEISEIDINLVFTKKDLILFCTKNGNILILSLQKQNFLKRLSPKNTKNSVINCLDITDDLNELICGYNDGVIEIINLINGDTKYTNNKIHKEIPCIELKIYKKDKNKNEIYFISSGEDGNVYYNTVKIGLTSIFWRINSSPVLTNISENPIYVIKIFDNYLNLSERYVILGSIDEISIYCIDPNIEKLFSIKKPNFIKECVVPDANVGIGILPGDDMTPGKNGENILLIISWDNIIYFYLLEINKQKIIINYQEIGNYINQNAILRIGFMSPSVIYIIDDTLSIKLIDTQRINKKKISLSKDNKKPIIHPINTLAEIQKNHFICPLFFSQSKIFDSQKKPIKTYLYSILENNSSLYVFGHKQVYNIKLINYDDYLNTFRKKEDYINLFSIGIQLYKNTFHALGNIPFRKMDEKAPKKLIDFLRQTISQYVILNTSEKNNIESINECVKLTIEFCIEIEAVEFLLNSIEPIFESKDLSKLFLEKFTPFVLRDKIEKIILSSEIILNLFDLYYKNGMSDNLSHMLLHMNIKSLDNKEIKNKMEELNLITPLLYLYINGSNQDYLLPLQKMFNSYKKASDLKLFLTDEDTSEIDYGLELNNNKNKYLNLERIVESKEYNGHRILWYIRWILTGKKFPYEEKNIEKNIFEDLVPKITYWLLNEKVIKEFLEFDPKNYFVMHKNIFSSKNLYDLLIKTSNNPKTKISILASLFNDVFRLNDIHPLSLIEYIIAWCKHINKNKIYFYLYDFIISVSKIDNIKKEIKIESACFILKYYNEIVKSVDKLKIEYLNIRMMDFLNEKDKFNSKDYQTILDSIVNNTFDEVKLFLYNQLGDYKKTIEFLLNDKNNIKNRVKRLYQFLRNKTEEFKNTKDDYYKLIGIIKDNIVNLAKISMKDFYELSKEIFWDEKKEIIKKLYKEKTLQLEYVEMIISSYFKVDEDNNNIIDIDENDDEAELKYLLELQIKLLCELKKFDDIVPTLKLSSFYPLKECFEYCDKAGAYEACIYIYLREANYENALHLATKKLNEVYDELYQNVNKENNEEKKKKLLINFDKYLNDCKRICEDNYQEDLWFELLQTLYNYEKNSSNINDNIGFNELNQKMLQEIKELMEKMSAYVSISRIIEVVTEKNKNAGFKEFRELLIKILNNYDNLSNILISARRLLTNLVLENENYFQTLNLKGEPMMIDKCDKCQQKIDINSKNRGEILAFLCNHCFHKECVIKKNVYECPLCRELEIGEMENKGMSLVRRKTTLIEDIGEESKQVQVNVNNAERKMIIRLNKFDKKFFTNRKMLTDSIEGIEAI